MLLNLMTYVLIPAYTLLFIKGSHLFDSNFSVHGNLPSNQLAFLLWGVLVGIYFYVLINRILMRFQEARLESILLKTAILLLFMAVTTPYLPEQFPFQSKLHIVFAFLASLLLLLILYRIVGRAYWQHRSDYRIYLYSLHFITAMSCLFFLLVGIVSTALEVFFSLSCVVLTCNLYKQIKEHNEIH